MSVFIYTELALCHLDLAVGYWLSVVEHMSLFFLVTLFWTEHLVLPLSWSITLPPTCPFFLPIIMAFGAPVRKTLLIFCLLLL